jgi:hypothetical protein
MRLLGMLFDVWLLVVALAYAGAIKMHGMLADLALVTVIFVLAGAIWKYLIALICGRTRRSSNEG